MSPKLNELIKNTNAKVGRGRAALGLRKVREDMKIVDFPRLPTGIFPLDYALAGGIPVNTPVQLFGPWQGGKTTLFILLAKSLSKMCMNPRCLRPVALCKCGPARRHMKAALIQTEGMPPEPEWFETLDYDIENNLAVFIPDYGEMACEMIEAALKSDDCGLVGVDSLAGIIPKAELEGTYADWQVALQSRLVAKMFRRVSTILVNEWRRGHMVSLVYLNQIRAVIGGVTSRVPLENTPGGYAAKHGYRLSVRVSQLSGDAKSGEVDSKESVKNVLKFSASMMGQQAKQQLFVLGGRAEYKIVARPFKGFPTGVPLDLNDVVTYGKTTGVLETSHLYKGYKLRGTNIIIPDNKAMADVFKTGNLPTANGVISDMDEGLRWLIVRAARQKALARLAQLSGRAPLVATPPEQPPPEQPDPSEVEELLESEDPETEEDTEPTEQQEESEEL